MGFLGIADSIANSISNREALFMYIYSICILAAKDSTGNNAFDRIPNIWYGRTPTLMDSHECSKVAMLYKKCLSYSGTNGKKYCGSFHHTLSRSECPRYEDLIRNADIVEKGQRDHLNDSIMTNDKSPCGPLTMMLYKECTSKLGSDHASCTFYKEKLARYCCDGKPIPPVWKRMGQTLHKYWGDKVDAKTSA